MLSSTYLYILINSSNFYLFNTLSLYANANPHIGISDIIEKKLDLPTSLQLTFFAEHCRNLKLNLAYNQPIVQPVSLRLSVQLIVFFLSFLFQVQSPIETNQQQHHFVADCIPCHIYHKMPQHKQSWFNDHQERPISNTTWIPLAAIYIHGCEH